MQCAFSSSDRQDFTDLVIARSTANASFKKAVISQTNRTKASVLSLFFLSRKKITKQERARLSDVMWLADLFILYVRNAEFALIWPHMVLHNILYIE